MKDTTSNGHCEHAIYSKFKPIVVVDASGDAAGMGEEQQEVAAELRGNEQKEKRRCRLDKAMAGLKEYERDEHFCTEVIH